MMLVFTLEVAGRPVLSMRAPSLRAASVTTGSASFGADLMLLENEGRPLWDGRSPTNLRPADEEELAAFERAFAKAIKAGEAGKNEEWIAFLVPVSVPPDI